MNGQQVSEKSLVNKEMQIKTTMSSQPTPVRMAIIEKSRDNKCWHECVEKGTLVYCSWDCKLVQPLWKNSMEVPQEIRNRSTKWSTIPLLGMCQKEMKTVTQKDVCTATFIDAFFIIVNEKGLTGQKSRWCQGCILFHASSTFWKPPAFLGSWPPFNIFKASNGQLSTSVHHWPSNIVTPSWLPSPSFFHF